MSDRKRINPVVGALLCGIFASTVVSLIWFIASKKARDIGIALLILSVVAFAVWFFVLLLLKKTGKACKIIVLVIVTALNFCAYFSVSVYYLVPTQLFYPQFDEEDYMRLKAQPDVQEIEIESCNGKLFGWFIKNQVGKAPLIIYYAGNGDNASDWIERFPNREAYKIIEGCNFVMIDYPGYGKSEGKPEDGSLREYALAVYDAMALRDDVDSEKIIICGYSIGTGVANYVAACRDSAGLVLMAPYAQGTDLINRFVPIFYGPLEGLISYRMPAVEFAADVRVMPLIFASPDDETVGYDSSERLSKAYADSRFITCPGLKHNDFWDDARVIEKTSEYIKERIVDD